MVRIHFLARLLNNDFFQVKSLFSRDSLSSRPTEYFHKYIRGTNGVVRGIIHNSGAVWQEQRRFALRALRDFGFGKSDMESFINEEVQQFCDSAEDVLISAINKEDVSLRSSENCNGVRS